MPKLRLFVLAGVAAMLSGSGTACAADVRLFPDDTEVVISVYPKQISASPLVAGEKGALDQPRAILDVLAAEQPVLGCLRRLGIDFFRDLTCVRLAGPRGKEFHATFVTVEGNFAALKRREKLAAGSAGLKSNSVGRATVYEVGAAEKRQYAAIVNETTLVAARSTEALADALARADGSKKSGLPKGFSAMLAADSDSASVSAVATGHAASLLMATLAVPNVETAAAAIKTLEAVSATVTVAKDIQFQVGVFARDEETAKTLADASVNAIATVRHLTDQKAGDDKKMVPVAEVVKSLAVANRGGSVFLSGRATLDQVEDLIHGAPVRPLAGRKAE